MFLLAPALAALLGCSSGPLFNQISGVTIQIASPNGLQTVALEQTGLQLASNCLTETAEVDQATTEKRQLLQTTYLIEVHDAGGSRNFEMITDQHMKGREKYYENRCIHQIVEKYALR